MRESRVYISPSLADRDWARQFAESLRGHGFDVWFDEWSIRPGDSIPEAMERGLRESDLLVLVLGRESTNRPDLFFELGAAVGMGKRVVPVVPQELDPAQLPPPIRHKRYLIKRSPQDTAEELAAESGELRPASV